MADPDALRYWRIAQAPFTHDLVALMDWLEESGSDVSPFQPIADLSFFAVQTRYDDSVDIRSPDWQSLVWITSTLLETVRRELTEGA